MEKELNLNLDEVIEEIDEEDYHHEPINETITAEDLKEWKYRNDFHKF